MRKRKKDQPVEDETLDQAQPEQEEVLTGELVTGPREYVLKKTIIYKGDEKAPGDKVELNDRQAKWLKGSGHI
ncbi:DUF7210 family protein [Marinobacter nauticus]|uniref:DUF7210 domain-containing protein n=1 Tax=Marinobacter nauticus TaxID=2743 RepID=A0A833JQC2_MARNT|nr:hypothetical protein [Marinobacter nauticus]KAE8546149.1 hypothetical protein F6453_1395 [Marinobacter nauticus]